MPPVTVTYPPLPSTPMSRWTMTRWASSLDMPDMELINALIDAIEATVSGTRLAFVELTVLAVLMILIIAALAYEAGRNRRK